VDRLLGLSREPFALVADGALYWESDERADLRQELAAALRQGRSVRLQGPPGSGRRSLLARVAGDLAAAPVPVALCEAPHEATPEAFLSALGETLGAKAPAGADLLTLAEHLYRRLVEVFCTARSAVVVLPWVAAGAVAEEIGILAELRLLGRPLVAVAVLDAPPLTGGELVSFAVPPLTADDLRDCLAQRCAAVGRADLLPPAALEACLAAPLDLPTALDRARRVLRAQVFAAALGQDATTLPRSEPPLFDPTQMQEMRRLLDSLSPDTV